MTEYRFDGTSDAETRQVVRQVVQEVHDVEKARQADSAAFVRELYSHSPNVPGQQSQERFTEEFLRRQNGG